MDRNVLKRFRKIFSYTNYKYTKWWIEELHPWSVNLFYECPQCWVDFINSTKVQFVLVWASTCGKYRIILSSFEAFDSVARKWVIQQSSVNIHRNKQPMTECVSSTIVMQIASSNINKYFLQCLDFEFNEMNKIICKNAVDNN